MAQALCGSACISGSSASSRPVAFSAEPSFDDTFLLRLPPADAAGASSAAARAGASCGQAADPSARAAAAWAARRAAVVAAARVAQGAAGGPVRPLRRAARRRRARQAAVGSLSAARAAAGAARRGAANEAQLLAVLKREREVEVAAERRLDHAKEWWQQYLDSRPAHKGRAVKLFALSEFGVRGRSAASCGRSARTGCSTRRRRRRTSSR